MKSLFAACAIAAAVAFPAGAYEEIPLLRATGHQSERAARFRLHRRRVARPSPPPQGPAGGSHEWIEFDGTQRAELLMNGYANVDDNVLALPGAAMAA